MVWSPKRWAYYLRTWQLSVLRLFYHSKRMKFIAGKTSARNVPTFSIFNTHTDSSFLCVYFGLNIFSAISPFFSCQFFLFSQTYWQLPRFCSIWHTEQGCHQLVLSMQSLVVTQQVGIAGGIFSSCLIFKPNKKAGVPRERFFIKVLKMRRIQLTDEAAEM